MSTSEHPARLQAFVITCVIASSAAYFFFSRAVRSELETAAYRRLLWTTFFTRPHGPLVEPLQIDARGIAAIIALAVLAILTGILIRRALGSQASDAAPEVLVYSMAAVVMPALLIATIAWPDGRGWLTTGVLLGGTAMCLAIAAALARRRPPLSNRHLPPDATSDGAFVIAFTVTAVAFLGVIVVVALSSLHGFDALAYHLPMAASWLRHSRLVTNVEESATFFFPGNAELFVRWILTSGADRLCFVPSLLEAGGCCYAIYKIALEIGQSRTAARISALSASSCVMLAFIAITAYMDAFLALTLLLATLFLLRALKAMPEDRAATVAFGTAIGLAVGSKYSAFQPAAILSLLWVWPVVRRHSRAHEGCLRFIDFRSFFRDVMPFAIPVVLCSAYWYARNAVEHGNPLFPFSILGLPGLPSDALIKFGPETAGPLDWLLYPWREIASRSFADYLGGVFGSVALVGLMAAAAQWGKNRHRDQVVLVTIASFVFWLITTNFLPRYAIFPVLLTFLFMGELWKQFDSRLLRSVILLVFAATLFIFGQGLATQAVYVTIAGRPRYGVPRAIDTLPPARLLNATPSMANYYLMGRDYRHEVITTFRKTRPEDLLRFRPDYVLLRREDTPAFERVARLDLVATSEPGDVAPAALYRVKLRSDPLRK